MNAFEETLKLPKPTIFFFFLFKEFYRIHENIWKLEEIAADSTIKKKIAMAQLENRSGSRGSNLVCEAGARDRNESALAFLGVKKKGANEWTHRSTRFEPLSTSTSSFRVPCTRPNRGA